MRFTLRFLPRNAAAYAVLTLAPLTSYSQDAVTPRPTPHVSFDGPGLNFDFPGVKIGVAEYEEGPTGTTVLYFPKEVKGAVDVRGGLPGTVNTDLLRLAYDLPIIDAITVSGGSGYGLSAATGVANAIKGATVDPGNFMKIALVPGAVIYDLDDWRFNAITPDDELGRAAFKAARPGWFPLGARGAGRFATQGDYVGDEQYSGQGAAFRQSGETKVLVVTIVNATGSIVDRKGQLVRCSHPVDGRCRSITEALSAHIAGLGNSKSARANSAQSHGLTHNTTITVVVTNRALPFWALQRLAVQVHTSMARAIQPFSTGDDGDTLFAVTTGEIKGAGTGDEDFGNAAALSDLGVLASETAWDAVLASLPTVPVRIPRTNIVPSSLALDSMVGRYTFAPDAIAEIKRHGAGLEIQLTGRTSFYFPTGHPMLIPVATDEFEIAGPREDRLHIDRDAHGAVAGITINPGPWPVHATRLLGK